MVASVRGSLGLGGPWPQIPLHSEVHIVQQTDQKWTNKNNDQSWTERGLAVWLAADNQKAAKRVWHKNNQMNTIFDMKICEKQIYNPKEKPGGKLFREAPRIVQFSWKW